jgi:hypothetical protein
MEKTMSKSNDTSKLDAKLENRPLANTELDAVTGGTKANGSASFFEALAQAWGNALDKQADVIQSN